MMRIQRGVAAWLLLGGWGVLVIETRECRAEEPSPGGAPARVISLDRIAEAGGGTAAAQGSPQATPAGRVTRYPVRPSRQALDYRGLGGNQALAKLRNPFDGSGPVPQPRGSVGLGSPQYRAAPGVMPPAGAPGMISPGGGVPGSTQGVTGSMPPAPSPSPFPGGGPGVETPSAAGAGITPGLEPSAAGAPPAQGPGAPRRHQGLPVRRPSSPRRPREEPASAADWVRPRKRCR